MPAAAVATWLDGPYQRLLPGNTSCVVAPSAAGIVAEHMGLKECDSLDKVCTIGAECCGRILRATRAVLQLCLHLVLKTPQPEAVTEGELETVIGSLGFCKSIPLERSVSVVMAL